MSDGPIVYLLWWWWWCWRAFAVCAPPPRVLFETHTMARPALAQLQLRASRLKCAQQKRDAVEHLFVNVLFPQVGLLTWEPRERTQADGNLYWAATFKGPPRLGSFKTKPQIWEAIGRATFPLAGVWRFKMNPRPWNLRAAFWCINHFTFARIMKDAVISNSERMPTLARGVVITVTELHLEGVPLPRASKGKDHMNNHYSNRFKLEGTQSNRLISYKKKNQFHSHLDTIECVWRGQLLNTQIRSIIGRGWGGALSWRLMHFQRAKSGDRHSAQARLHGGCQRIGWGLPAV